MIKTVRHLLFFPFRLVPTALFVGSLVMSMRALARVRRLERRLAALSGR